MTFSVKRALLPYTSIRAYTAKAPRGTTMLGLLAFWKSCRNFPRSSASVLGSIRGKPSSFSEPAVDGDEDEGAAGCCVAAGRDVPNGEADAVAAGDAAELVGGEGLITCCIICWIVRCSVFSAHPMYTAKLFKVRVALRFVSSYNAPAAALGQRILFKRVWWTGS